MSGQVEFNLAGNRQELENKSAPVLEAVFSQKSFLDQLNLSRIQRHFVGLISFLIDPTVY